ncbi:MAG: PQQ-dependent sugar dehydrogenase [Burkholderiales bacterium]|jgi:glucose/arabinose dehydrogenase|nr:PQQ-dependent sugar dehydrogenase [Burkholderiales bacterium]
MQKSFVHSRYWVGLALLTAALAAQSQTSLRAEAVATGLDSPWAVAFLPQGRFLVTERTGQLRVIEADGRKGEPVSGLPKIAVGGQGGLLDVVLDAGFDRNRQLYFCYSEPDEKDASLNSTAMASAKLSADGSRLEAVKVLFSQRPRFNSRLHFGCRIVEARDGTLFLSLGERSTQMQHAQRLDSHLGKVVRLNKDGTVPKDNPFVGRSDARPEIWSWGHRNSQGAALAPDGTYWMHEHGPQGGDEINVPQAGRNYGWPLITYGERYGGGNVTDGSTQRDGLEQPLHQWTPSIAPSGMAFVTSDRYGEALKGRLLVGSLKFRYLAALTLDGRKVTGEQRLLQDVNQRIRDVRQGPDGYIYVLTDGSGGRLLRLQPGS